MAEKRPQHWLVDVARRAGLVTDAELGGRICTVANVFDALTSNRCYRDAAAPFATVRGVAEGGG